jgi:dCTP deaminase
MEELRLPKTIWGRANPKSTTGRIDVFTRLITESGGEFESVSEGYHGKLYTEIVPRTFSITVHEGARLNQLRLGQGNAENFSRKLKRETLVYTEHELPGKHQLSDEKLWLTVDLQGDPDSRIVGYRAKRNAPIIDLARVNYYDPEEFWEPVHRTKRANLILDPQDFYILASKQRVSIPPSWAAEMVPYDPSMGEFRIHYAGFFDPGFGYGAEDVPGTQAVLEVRSHEVPFLLEDGQTVGRLEFEPLLEVPKRIYGQGIGSSYQRQGLALSKHFRRG